MEKDKIKKSFLVPLVKSVVTIFCLISPYQIIARLLWEHHELIPFWYAEAYVLTRLLVVSLAFFLFRDPSGIAYSILSVICILMLCDLLVGTARIFFVEREDRYDAKGHFVLVRDVSRWVILVFMNVAEIALYFGVLYLKVGVGFSDQISDRLTALYQSLLTFTTLGYGEIHPVSQPAKLLVMFQMIYFVIFIFLVVPVVFSAVRVKEHTTEEFGKTEEEQKSTQKPDQPDK